MYMDEGAAGSCLYSDSACGRKIHSQRQKNTGTAEEKRADSVQYSDKASGLSGAPHNPNGSVDDIAGVCDPTGRILGMIALAGHEAQKLMDSGGWITYTATSENKRVFNGKVQLIPSQGVSIISDIDDTIKITEVYTGGKTMLLNPFNRPMQPAHGISAFYRRLNNPDTRFHYLSGSPWQLYPVLEKFLSVNTFPPGSINMKEFRANPMSVKFWEDGKG